MEDSAHVWQEEKILVECDIEAQRDPVFLLSKIKSNPRAQRGRTEATVNEDVVLVYAMQMEAGDQFPAIVVNEKGTLWAGNHRVPALRLAGITEHPALVVSGASAAQEKKFLSLSNACHGLPASLDDRVYNAMNLHQAHGVPLEEAAKIAGIPIGRVANRINEEKVIARARRLSVNLPKKVSAVRRLATVPSDRIFESLATVADRFNVAEFSLLCTAATKARSENAAVKLIVEAVRELDKERERRIGVKPGRSGAYPKFQAAFRACKKLPIEAETLALSEDLRASVIRDAEDAVAALTKRLGWLK